MSELLYSPAAYGIDIAARDAPRPRARANPMLAVAGNTLWLLGGVVEVRWALSWFRAQGLRPGLARQKPGALHRWRWDVAELLVVQ